MIQHEPDCKCTSIDKWIIGGHSASGQVAHKAIHAYKSLADAEIGLDPFDCGDEVTNDLPSLFWGFAKTTCHVNYEKSAQACYVRTNQKNRVYYRVDVPKVWNICGHQPLYYHCSFCDHGSIICNNCAETPATFYVDVANSIRKFVDAVKNNDWSRDNFILQNSKTPLTLFVNDARP